MRVDSFDGPVTQNEINSFKSYIQTLTPAPVGQYTIWIFFWPNSARMPTAP